MVSHYFCGQWLKPADEDDLFDGITSATRRFALQRRTWARKLRTYRYGDPDEPRLRSYRRRKPAVPEYSYDEGLLVYCNTNGRLIVTELLTGRWVQVPSVEGRCTVMGIRIKKKLVLVEVSSALFPLTATFFRVSGMWTPGLSGQDPNSRLSIGLHAQYQPQWHNIPHGFL